jgi:hypothetical protein
VRIENGGEPRGSPQFSRVTIYGSVTLSSSCFTVCIANKKERSARNSDIQTGRVTSQAWTIPTIDATSNPSSATPAMRKPELRLAASAM